MGQEDPLEEGKATHCSILAWRIPWTEEPDGLQSVRSQSRTQRKQLSTDSKKIGEKAALQAALEDAGFTPDEVTDIDIEYEKTPSSAWYEVDFESGRTDYEYRIDAHTGEILSATTD